MSQLSIAGQCEVCGQDICQACWAIRKMRHCSAHTETADGPAADELDETRTESDTDSPPVTRVRAPSDQPASEIEKLRQSGAPVVTAAEARLAEEGFLRAFAQRLETIEELPDPLSGHVIPLRKARVRHILEPADPGSTKLPMNRCSRFALHSGGWGKPKSGLVLEARFLSRTSAFKSQGYDAEPLGISELMPALTELRALSGKDNCFRVALLGSPTGWDQAAITTTITQSHGQAFRDQRVGVALYDLHADTAHVDREDGRLWDFWPLLSPAGFAHETTRSMDLLRDLLTKMDGVALDFAARSLGLPPSWIRAAFSALTKSGAYIVNELPELGLVLSRKTSQIHE